MADSSPFPRTWGLLHEAERRCAEVSFEDGTSLVQGEGTRHSPSREFGREFGRDLDVDDVR